MVTKVTEVTEVMEVTALIEAVITEDHVTITELKVISFRLIITTCFIKTFLRPLFCLSFVIMNSFFCRMDLFETWIKGVQKLLFATFAIKF